MVIRCSPGEQSGRFVAGETTVVSVASPVHAAPAKGKGANISERSLWIWMPNNRDETNNLIAASMQIRYTPKAD